MLARSPGFLSASTTTVIVSTVDLSGVNLSLGLGGVLTGTVTVAGDTSGLASACRTQLAGGCPDSGIVLFVQAYNLATFAATVAPVRLSTSASLASATFTVTGLESGAHVLRAFLPGFQLDPAGGARVSVSTPSVAVASVTLRPDDARLRLDVRLRALAGGACYSAADFKTTGFYVDLRPEAAPIAGGDITRLAPQALETFHCSSMTFVSPPFGPGNRAVWVVSGSSGAASRQDVLLAHGTTASYVADLTAAVYTVTGTITVGGTLSFTRPDGAVTVSSAAGLAALAPATSYCLLSASAPVRLSAARVELVPLDPDGEPPGSLLLASSVGGDCGAYSLPGARLANGLPDPGFKTPALVAYPGAVRADGTFSIGGVPAGSYWLRANPDLDGDPSDGDEAAEFRTIVRVSSNGSLGAVPFSPGAGLRGLVYSPPQVVRPLRVTLSSPDGRVLRRLDVRSTGTGPVAFSFPRVGPGRWILRAEDLGFPKAYAAAPLVVDMPAADFDGAELRLAAGGTIRVRAAVETLKADGGKEAVLVTAANPELLPSGLRVNAIANPSIQGGFFTARGRNCGPDGTCRDVALDSNGQIAIENVLPGIYDVEFAAPTDPDSVAQGGAALASQVRSGVRVAEGESVDLGTVRLQAGAVLTGRALDSGSGRAAANVRVQAFPSLRQPGDENRRRRPSETLTDADGRYALTGLDPVARYYDVVAAARGIEPAGSAVPPYEPRIAAAVDLRSTSTLDFSLLYASFSVTGRVLVPAGAVLATAVGDGERPGASVFLQKAGVVPFRDPVADIQALTDADGRFS
ncbi:MAG: hypothetical protein HY925_13920, partial [Elusimicrobia bacterium]|nr:hypothetical protein [Elusimicrobiota bacterium]